MADSNEDESTPVVPANIIASVGRDGQPAWEQDGDQHSDKRASVDTTKQGASRIGEPGPGRSLFRYLRPSYYKAKQGVVNKGGSAVYAKDASTQPPSSKCHRLFSCFSAPQRPKRSNKSRNISKHAGMPLLGPIAPEHNQTLILDLDETLVHSSFNSIPNPDFIIPVEIDSKVHQVYVMKRPGVDQFLQFVGQRYECVIFTASLRKYADPLVDLLDPLKLVTSRLFREDCVFHNGSFVKDLSRLGRELQKCIIIDNAAGSYMFHPENALPCSSWFDDEDDTELIDLMPVLEETFGCEDVTVVLSDILTNRPPFEIKAEP